MDIMSKKVFMDAFYPIFRDDSKRVLLVGDMGFNVLNSYFENFPDRVFNVGISEQAMISMAAGLALTGMKPSVYAQIPFLTMRAFEQIRFDICEHNLPVSLIGVGANNYFKQLGRSHCMDNDDIELMKLLTNIKTVTANSKNIDQILYDLGSSETPFYIRTL